MIDVVNVEQTLVLQESSGKRMPQNYGFRRLYTHIFPQLVERQ